MTLIDDRGRLFGRVNLVDGLVAAVLLLLIPLGYATYLMFRPAAPRIDSVEASLITKEEERISVGGNLVAKFKVRGSGLSPLLRARIDRTDALAFVFESPYSADVLVGPVSSGSHDLVLLDGVQEVARAKGAITIQAAASFSIRAAGWITDLDAETAAALKVGTALPDGAPAYRVLALGPLVPAHQRISLAGTSIDMPVSGKQARRALLTLECGAGLPSNPCALGDRLENRTPPVNIGLPGPTRYFSFALDEILPEAPPARAVLRVRMTPGQPAVVHAGDRDDLLDERAAVVSSVNGDMVTLDAGIDKSLGGWQYRSQRLIPGRPFVFATERYQASGTLQSVDLRSQP